MDLKIITGTNGDTVGVVNDEVVITTTAEVTNLDEGAQKLDVNITVGLWDILGEIENPIEHIIEHYKGHPLSLAEAQELNSFMQHKGWI